MEAALKTALQELAAYANAHSLPDDGVISSGDLHYYPSYKLTFGHARNPESAATSQALREMAVYAKTVRRAHDERVLGFSSLTFGQIMQFV